VCSGSVMDQDGGRQTVDAKSGGLFPEGSHLAAFAISHLSAHWMGSYVPGRRDVAAAIAQRRVAPSPGRSLLTLWMRLPPRAGLSDQTAAAARRSAILCASASDRLHRLVADVADQAGHATRPSTIARIRAAAHR
jgi:hypothetical protein